MSDYPVLELSADFGDGTVTGEFHLAAGVEINEEVSVSYLVGGAGEAVTAVFSDYFAGGVEGRESAYVDVGAGAHVFEIAIQSFSGSDQYQWGNTGQADAPTQEDATGGTALQQKQVLLNYLRHGRSDSVSPAHLTVGEYSSAGFLDDEIDVTIPAANGFKSPNMGSARAELSLTCVEVADLSVAQEALKQKLGF